MEKMIDTNKKIVVTKNQISTQLTGETIILNHKIGLYYSLNEVGTFIWDELNKIPLTIDELKFKVSEAFEVEQSEIDTDISNLINELNEEELIEFI